MNPALIVQLTNEYIRAIEREWSILRIGDVEVPLEDTYSILYERDGETLPLRLSQVMNQGQNLVFIGEPGSGKSTTVQFIGLCFSHEDWHKTKLNSSKTYIPIKIGLKDYSAFLSEPGPKIEQAISLAIREYLRQIDEESARDLIGHWINRENLLLLLDGLDEVPDILRGAVKDEIFRFSSFTESANVKIIVTSRLAGYSSLGSAFKEFDLIPFKASDDIKPYLQFWLTALRPGISKTQADRDASHLLEQMENHSALQRIMDNPLVLRIATQVYVTSGELTDNRSKLYQQYISDLWDRAKKRGVDANLESHILMSAEALAWQLQTNNLPDIPVETMSVFQDKMGLVRQAGTKLSFSHTNLQEYFVSRRLAYAWQTNPQGAWEFLRPRLHIPEWQEPILLMGAALSQAEADHITQKIYFARSAFERRYHRDKILIATLAGEGAYVNPKIIGRILSKVSLINTGWGKWIIGEGVYELEYLIEAIGNFGLRALPVLSKLLYNQDDMVQVKAIDVLAKMNVREAIPILLALNDKTDNYLINRTALDALAQYKEKSIIPELMRNVKVGDWGSYTLARFRDVEIIPALFQLLEDDTSYVANTIGSVAETLSYMGPIVIPYLYPALENENPKVRRSVILTLEKMSDQEAIPYLRMLLWDKDSDVRDSSIYALASLNATDAISDLRYILLNDKVDWARRTAAQALGSLRAKEAISDLVQALKDSSEHVRETAVGALRNIGAHEVLYQITPINIIPRAFEVFRKEFPKFTYGYEFSETVAILEDRMEDSINYLYQQLQNTSDVKARWAAAEILKRMHATIALPILREALWDENKIVRRKVIEAIRELNGTDAISDIEKILKESGDLDSRRDAALALGELKAYETIPSLRKALQDEDTQTAAAIALGRMKVLEAIPFLRRREEKRAQISRITRRLAIIGFLKFFPALKNKDLRLESESFADSQVLEDLISTPPTFANKNESDLYVSELKQLLRLDITIPRKAILGRLEIMQTRKDHNNQDPFQKVAIPHLAKIMRSVLYVTTYMFAATLISILVIVYGSVEGILQESLKEAIRTYIVRYPAIALLILIILSILVALIGLVNERLKVKM